jgi:hypothetical protein
LTNTSISFPWAYLHAHSLLHTEDTQNPSAYTPICQDFVRISFMCFVWYKQCCCFFKASSNCTPPPCLCGPLTL